MDIEKADAERVDEAERLIAQREFGLARAILLRVASNTPAAYVNEFYQGDELRVKLWSALEFMQLVSQRIGTGNLAPVAWVPNAYPRAHFFLGWLAMEEGDLRRALSAYRIAHALQPKHPQILCELGQVNIRLCLYNEAERCFEEVLSADCFASDWRKAVAHRGLGCICIEKRDLDSAEAHYRTSLGLEPGSPVATQQLEFIGMVRARTAIGNAAAGSRLPRTPDGRREAESSLQHRNFDFARIPQTDTEAIEYLTAAKDALRMSRSGEGADIDRHMADTLVRTLFTWATDAFLRVRRDDFVDRSPRLVEQQLLVIERVMCEALECDAFDNTKADISKALGFVGELRERVHLQPTPAPASAAPTSFASAQSASESDAAAKLAAGIRAVIDRTAISLAERNRFASDACRELAALRRAAGRSDPTYRGLCDAVAQRIVDAAHDALARDTALVREGPRASLPPVHPLVKRWLINVSEQELSASVREAIERELHAIKALEKVEKATKQPDPAPADPVATRLPAPRR